MIDSISWSVDGLTEDSMDSFFLWSGKTQIENKTRNTS